jgi:hypothetical protein
LAGKELKSYGLSVNQSWLVHQCQRYPCFTPPPPLNGMLAHGLQVGVLADPPTMSTDRTPPPPKKNHLSTYHIKFTV